MGSDQNYSLLWLWVLQVAWALAAWLPLALVAILIALAIRWLHYRAKSIEGKKVEPGFVGFLKIIRDYTTHLTIGKAMFHSIILGLALGGTIAVGLQNFIQPQVEKVNEQKASPTDFVEYFGQRISIDFILVLALILSLFLIVIGLRVYRSLRHRASELAGRMGKAQSPRPLLVRLFHDSAKLGVLVLAIAGLLSFGMLMQIVGLMLVFLPLPRAITGMSFPHVITAFIWILSGLGLVLFLAFFAPSIWMKLRNFKLQLRYYRDNRIFRTGINVYTSIFVCLVGALINMWLINYLGRFIWPSIFR
jgi:hypothetical protein